MELSVCLQLALDVAFGSPVFFLRGSSESGDCGGHRLADRLKIRISHSLTNEGQ